ncbi:hypothetical protein ACO22_07573 [Paracoccidioides brasiliensis]|uniref:Uncharacterized protein n=1 Tax=Paracoccidioides brasiliensis TaxID=121759 RepID=A0A1D2J4A7_PARBR|nr:hypothetical protein ACO22_07573 [Paracoccidioides brasiliensis]
MCSVGGEGEENCDLEKPPIFSIRSDLQGISNSPAVDVYQLLDAFHRTTL